MKTDPKHRAAPAPRTTPHKAGPRTDWGQVADWYDQHVGDDGSEYHRKVVVPGALRLLALQTGETAIDVACGQGVLCRAIHEKGIQGTGVDAALELIESARQRSGDAIR
jgi:2-polyprenyl-3-methyl-5-hydroxy-6-metoxy-1,4-benzoquinol methylase